MNLAFFGHHKCASTSTSYICFELSNTLGIKPIYKKTAFDNSFINDFSYQNNFLISLNSKYEPLKKVNDFKGFHIIRDPRDICISGYYSHLKTHKIKGFDRLIEHRKKLNSVSFEEGLLHEIDFQKLWLQHIKNWDYSNSQILEIKMEDLVNDYQNTWIKISKHLEIIDSNKKGLTNPKKNLFNRLIKKTSLRHHLRLNKYGLSKADLIKIIEDNSFSALSKGRSIGNENTNSHYRKGGLGDWKNLFNEEHKNYFKEVYGDLLIQLGYEKNNDW